MTDDGDVDPRAAEAGDNVSPGRIRSGVHADLRSVRASRLPGTGAAANRAHTCHAPGLMETIKPGGTKSDGRAEEVPRRAAGTSDPARAGREGRAWRWQRRVRADRDAAGHQPGNPAGWVAQAEIDAGARPGTTADQAARLAELERENRELRRANAILKSASAFFAARRSSTAHTGSHRQHR
jgi:transposase